MTQKDYIKLAQALKDSKPSMFLMGENYYKGVIQTWVNTVETIAMTLQHDNPRFNTPRFLAACGYNN